MSDHIPNVSLLDSVLSDDTKNFTFNDVATLTIQIAADRKTVIGRSGTLFSTEYVSGHDLLVFTTPTLNLDVASITNNTQLVLVSAPATSFFNQEYMFADQIGATSNQTIGTFSSSSNTVTISHVTGNQSFGNFTLASAVEIVPASVSVFENIVGDFNYFRVEEIDDVVIQDAFDRRAVIGRSTYFTTEYNLGDALVVDNIKYSVDTATGDNNLLLTFAPDVSILNRPYTFELIVVGEANQVIAPFVQTTNADVIGKATASNSIGIITQTASAKPIVKATSSLSIGSFGFTSSGTVTTHATFIQTINNFTQNALSVRPTQYADANQSIGMFSYDLSAEVPIETTAANPIGVFASTLTANVPVEASFINTIQPFTQDATIFRVLMIVVDATIDDPISTTDIDVIAKVSGTSSVPQFNQIAMVRRKRRRGGAMHLMF